MRGRSRGLVRFVVFLLAVGVPAGGAGDRLVITNGSKPDEKVVLRTTGGEQTNLFMLTEGGDSELTFYATIDGLRWDFRRIDELLLWSRVLDGEISVRGRQGGLVLESDNPSQRYLVDSDEDNALANHIWYQNSTGGATDWRMMQLNEVAGGSLLVNGPVTQNHSFDLAEAFWEQEAVEAGELVAVDAERPDAVRPTTAPYQAAVLGVASANPGFVLGGGSFSLEALERTWGAAVAEEYRQLRPELERQVLSELPDLAHEAGRLRSLASFEEDLARQQLEFEAGELGDGRPPRPARAESYQSSPESLRRAYEKALVYHEESMFDRTVQRFFKDRFTTVALAGRVPVKMDAAFGAILPGDYLTSSPVSGVAMKATAAGPVIGTALEAHSGGSGIIQVFVHRGWYGGAGLSVGGSQSAGAATTPQAKDREIAELRRQLAALTARLDRVAGAGSSIAASKPVSRAESSPSP